MSSPVPFTKLAVLLAGLLSGAGTGSAAGAKPNIVFIFPDQLRSQSVGCYGAEAPRTPNIDRLAAEGARFTRAYSTYPVCSPFRAMLMTGLYPMRNGMVTNDMPLRPGVPSFAMALKDSGYHTAYIGKWHIDGHGRDAYIPAERRMGFDHWMALECTHSYNKSKYYAGDSEQPVHWEGYDAIAQTHAAQEYIKDRAGKEPFALFLSWGPPHDPYTAPEEYLKRHPPEDMVFRPNVSERDVADAMFASQRSRMPAQYQPLRDRMRKWLDDDAEIRKSIAGYHAAIECLDDLIGELRGTLEAQGILDNTIVVFTSDHGDQLGSHRTYGKDMPFEESISIPFIVRYPSKICAGTVTDALLSPVDIMPTLLSLAGAPCPKVDGLDLGGAATGEPGPRRDALLLMHLSPICNTWLANAMDAWRGVRDARYTYARHDDGTPWLLYDNEADPFQMRNLVDDPEHTAERDRLDARCAALMREAGDPGNQAAIHDYILQVQPGQEMIKALRAANPGK